MTATTTTTTTTARAWVGCLSCYNHGRLVGDWFDAIDADMTTIEEVHVGYGNCRFGCEEMWVMDHEGLPISGECSPATATAWAELLESVDEWQRDAFIAWVSAGDYAEDVDGLPTVSDFEDTYCGEWDTFREYAESLADDSGMLADVPAEFVAYFDWERFARDLRHDYTTEDAAGCGVHVFRSL